MVPSASSGQVPSDGFTVVDTSVVASLLTCSPGEEIYELYGHTAIRMRWTEARGDSAFTYDAVFNFGVFDFNQPHFAWHFTLGECNYIVAPALTSQFLMEYERRGSSVTEQVLALCPYEALGLLHALDSVSRPENRTYLYNIFRNNCTTKARDIIEESIYGKVRYAVHPQRNTFRTILHEFTEGHPWAREGNDLLLGATVDTVITERDVFANLYDALCRRRLHRCRPVGHEALGSGAARATGCQPRTPGGSCCAAVIHTSHASSGGVGRVGSRLAHSPMGMAPRSRMLAYGRRTDDAAGFGGCPSHVYGPLLPASRRSVKLAGMGAEPSAAAFRAACAACRYPRPTLYVSPFCRSMAWRLRGAIFHSTPTFQSNNLACGTTFA